MSPRLFDRLFNRQALPERPRQLLRQANQLLENGDYLAAAALFEQSGALAQGHQRPRRAAALYLQAGRAYALAKNLDSAMICFYRGMDILVLAQRWLALRRFQNRTETELHHLGYPQQAQEITSHLADTWRQHPLPANTPAPATGQLPARCPDCGAPLRSDEVDWLEPGRAECPYCGSVILAG